MIASLPMYDRPQTKAANDALWYAIRDGLRHGPRELTRQGDLWDHWLSPDLVFSQTCGFPYRARLHDRVTLIGTPDYGLPGCPPGYYNSVLIARANDPRSDVADFAQAPLAYNDPMSQSGWAAPQNHAAAVGFAFTTVVQSGGHANSARAVASGQADIAAIDALTWTMMQRHDGFAAGLKEVTRTEPTPALPYITARANDQATMFTAVQTAISTLSDENLSALHLRSLVWVEPAAYLDVPTPPAPENTPVSA